MTRRLDGKAALVTGGAGGIGSGTSRHLAEQGAAATHSWTDKTAYAATKASIASLVAYLFSDAHYLTGQEFAVDGGMGVHTPGRLDRR